MPDDEPAFTTDDLDDLSLTEDEIAEYSADYETFIQELETSEARQACRIAGAHWRLLEEAAHRRQLALEPPTSCPNCAMAPDEMLTEAGAIRVGLPIDVWNVARLAFTREQIDGFITEIMDLSWSAQRDLYVESKEQESRERDNDRASCQKRAARAMASGLEKTRAAAMELQSRAAIIPRIADDEPSWEQALLFLDDLEQAARAFAENLQPSRGPGDVILAGKLIRQPGRRFSEVIFIFRRDLVAALEKHGVAPTGPKAARIFNAVHKAVTGRALDEPTREIKRIRALRRFPMVQGE